MGNVVKVIVYASAILGTGYGLMKFTVPSEEEMRKRLTPDLLREADSLKAKHLEQRQAFMDQMRAAAESDKPLWTTEPPHDNKKPA